MCEGRLSARPDKVPSLSAFDRDLLRRHATAWSQAHEAA
jgi:hypothetical protein